MHLVYDENERRVSGGFTVPYHKQNATAHYLRHYNNYLYLGFMLKHGNFQERHLASKELGICERKLKYWKEHPNFNLRAVETEVTKLKKQWEVPNAPPKQ